MSVDAGAIAARLCEAELELLGRFADASNATLLVRLLDRDPRPVDEVAGQLGREPELDDLPAGDLAVYKPVRGEAPLWDFPPRTLHLREVAAYELSAALGWDLVPVTVLREDGPLGPGSLQRFVPHDLDQHYFALLEERDAVVLEQLTAMVVFDLLLNNADRKGGHVLLEQEVTASGRVPTDRVRLIDHGITFHREPKLRTVGWHLAGQAVPARLREDVVALERALHAAVGEALARLLAPEELEALHARVRRTQELETFPEPRGPRSTPWPLV